MLGFCVVECLIEIIGVMIDFVYIENKIFLIVKKQKICFDEWNVWDFICVIGSEGVEEKCVVGVMN